MVTSERLKNHLDSQRIPREHQVRPDDTLGIYFQELNQSLLLNGEEESLLFKVYQEEMSFGEFQSAVLGGNKSDQWREYLTTFNWDEEDVPDSRRAFEVIVRSNLRLVVSIAKGYRGRGVPFLGLIQEGNQILVRKAIPGFRHELGYRFSTYAGDWIEQAVSRSVKKQGRTVRLPDTQLQRWGRLKAIMAEKKQELGREIAPKELAADQEVRSLLTLPDDQVKAREKLTKFLQWVRSSMSLQLPVDEDGDKELGEYISDPDQELDLEDRVLARVVSQEKGGELFAAMEKVLTPREEKIIKLRLGLRGEELSLDDIGFKFNLSRERVRQIEAEARWKMRLDMVFNGRPSEELSEEEALQGMAEVIKYGGKADKEFFKICLDIGVHRFQESISRICSRLGIDCFRSNGYFRYVYEPGEAIEIVQGFYSDENYQRVGYQVIPRN